MINRPSGIIHTGNKSYLLNFQKFTAPIRYIESFNEIEAMSKLFPIVLKPLEEYGGKGIIKVNGEDVEMEGEHFLLSAFKAVYEANKKPYLGMKFLRNVRHGDKRIVVAGGEVLSASLRLPAEGGWLCNIAQGGRSVESEADEREREIIQHITPILQNEGIFYYGLDTLENDEGVRVISELNTLSIGGIVTPAHEQGATVANRFASLMIKFMKVHL
jgi:glutathione synthase